MREACERGFFYQATNLEGLDNHLCTPGRLGYIGFDATAKSLHVGHLLPIFLLRLFQRHGHKPVALIGGATTKIGDPSFRNSARPMLSDEEISDNMDGMKLCLKKFIKFDGKDSALMVNNADWLSNLNYIDLLREVGTYFSINRMITFDSVKSKLTENNSLSFLEFNYMIMQGYDFLELRNSIGCEIQFGGQDQWGNIVSGVELIRKKIGKEVFGFTVPLLTTSNGQKMGKTAGGAVWLMSDMLSPYDFWQYWRNVDDADVIKFLYLFTDVEVAEIKKIESAVKSEKNTDINELKKLLADQITTITHGQAALDKIHKTAAALFVSKNADLKDLELSCTIPVFPIQQSRFACCTIVDIMVEAKLSSSKSEAKRMVTAGGVYVNDDKINDIDYVVSANNLSDNLVKISAGKKKHILVKVV